MKDIQIIQTLIESKEDSLCLVCLNPVKALKTLVEFLKHKNIIEYFKVNYKQRTIQYICNGCTLYLRTSSIGYRNRLGGKYYE